ncbi:MAG: NPCBM/NEW2 domain-containing protein [Kiritimatiellae bacterium]|nr:NPCBM/NEW2 domain-containing protein [Kiritimatiellia bacterium]
MKEKIEQEKRQAWTKAALLVAFLAGFGWAASAGVTYVESFDFAGATCGCGKRPQRGKSVDGNPLTVAGKTYEHGFGTHPESAILFRANGKVVAFDALVAIDDDAKKAGSGKSYGKPTAKFKVWADGRVVWRSDDVKLGQQPVAVHADLSGAKEIVLETTGGRQWTAFDAANADWLEARFTCADGAEIKSVNDPSLTAQLGILTPPEKPEPRINGADVWGVRPGHPVIFRVATSGVRPMTFSAKGLPAGVTLDAKGVLRGVAPATPGNYDIEVTAANAKGTATRVIRLAVGDTIALTPPMGWNSWNTLCYRLTAEKAKAAAKAMDDSGLADHGWAYVNLDDWWEMNNSGCPRVEMRKNDFGGREDVVGPARDAAGKIIPNRSFPDMKDLTDYIHSLGLKAGLYSSPGPLTCGKCEGSYGHELQDAESWAEWGFDYIKYDWCSYGDIFKKEVGRGCWEKGAFDDPSLREAFIKPYRLMGECLKKQKRDILYSFCQYGMAHTEEWGAAVGGQCWRSWEDLKDSWAWMELAIEGRIDGEYWKWNKPGWWADPDMMIVGQQYSFGSDHPTYLTPNEQYTHVSLWAMFASPLLIGCDLTTMDAFTRNLLVNDEVIAVSQDRLGKAGRRIRHTDAESIWTRPLVGGFTAVALVNRYPFAREIKLPLAEVGLAGECWVKDLWTQKCEGKHSGFYAVTVPPHATKLVKMRPVDCRKCD